MPAPHFTQCPLCSTTVTEGEGFNARVWLAAHVKVCSALAAVREHVNPNAQPPATGSTFDPTAVLSNVGEAFAKEFAKQLFKKPRTRKKKN